MKIVISVLLSLVLLASQPIFAHSEHAHSPISKEQAVSLASDIAKQLSVKDAGLDIGKLPASWAAITKENIAMYKKGKGYYIVAVENKNEKKTLYVLMSSGGEVYDANFSGEFQGVE